MACTSTEATAIVDGIELTLAKPDRHAAHWIDFNDYARRLEAAWLRLDDAEPQLSPRIVGEPGLGKTTLALHVARATGREAYVFQCTSDTQPEDLLITPVLAPHQTVRYRASAVVTAMLRGGALVLDEANRMPERSWASLAPLLDDRRLVDSVVAGVRIEAQPEFRVCVTTNEDGSVYELPGYIQSRLKPTIEIVAPPWSVCSGIVRSKCRAVDEDLLAGALEELRRRAEASLEDSVRDMLNLARYAQKLRRCGIPDPLSVAARQVLAGGTASEK